MKAPAAAAGFRVKSGWTVAVLLSGPGSAPRVIDSRRLELADPDNPETIQPYHAGAGELEEDRSILARRIRAVERCARSSVAEWLLEVRRAPRVAGLVIGSDVDPATLANPHIRAHALEGKLFRTVLESALAAHGIATLVVRERDAIARGAALLRLPQAALRRRLTDLRPTPRTAWRAEHKLAALAAWLALAPRPGRG